MNTPSRKLLIVGTVVAMHLLALWALQSGLLRRAAAVVVPVQLLAQTLSTAPASPPTPTSVAPPHPPPHARPSPPAKTVSRPQTIHTATPTPQLVTLLADTPAPSAPAGTREPQGTLPTLGAPLATASAAPGPPTPQAPPARLVEPVEQGDHNAREEWFRPPAISARLGEYGVVVLRITVGKDGRVSSASVKRSSGYPRLDETALRGAYRTPFKPATQAGQAVDFTYDNWPIRFEENR